MISGYYFLDNYSFDNPYGGANLPGFDSLNTGRAQMVLVGATKVLGPNAVNEFRFGFMRDAYVSGLPRVGWGLHPVH